MASYQIVFWRDIPAQVKVKAGRERAARQLSERFQVAIDRAAMRSGLFNTDDYLAEWRASEAQERDGILDEVAASVAAELEAAYTDARIDAIAANGGVEAK